MLDSLCLVDLTVKIVFLRFLSVNKIAENKIYFWLLSKIRNSLFYFW
jgi:hypothetical protein